MSQTTTFAIIAVVAALGLVGIVVVESITLSQVEAAKTAVGQCASTEGSTFHNSSVALCHTVR